MYLSARINFLSLLSFSLEKERANGIGGILSLLFWYTRFLVPDHFLEESVWFKSSKLLTTSLLFCLFRLNEKEFNEWAGIRTTEIVSWRILVWTMAACRWESFESFFFSKMKRTYIIDLCFYKGFQSTSCGNRIRVRKESKDWAFAQGSWNLTMPFQLDMQGDFDWNLGRSGLSATRFDVRWKDFLLLVSIRFGKTGKEFSMDTLWVER